MRYPGRSSMIVLNIIPVGPDRTLETYDFFLETPEPDETEKAAIHYLDKVLQVEDIALVESVQKGMNTPAFQQGRIVNDPNGSGKSEHALHHFHGLVLDAYARAASWQSKPGEGQGFEQHAVGKDRARHRRARRDWPSDLRAVPA